MTEIVLHDVDPVLLERIRRVAHARGWTLPRTLLHLLEQGLHVYEGDGRVSFDASEHDVLQAALAALQDIPDDGGFAMIGRVDAAGAAVASDGAGRGPAPPPAPVELAIGGQESARDLFP